MTDYFALLNEPRRPWLDLDALKAKFLELSAAVHPDRVHGVAAEEKQIANQRYADLNAAYLCLREPKHRLQHLLELEFGAKPKDIQQISAATMDLFTQVGQLCREVDNFVARRAQIGSPVLKVELFEQAQEWTDNLNAALRELNTRQKALAAELKQLNPAWETAPATGKMRSSQLPLQQLERIWRDYSYLSRWSGQIQERVVQLLL